MFVATIEVEHTEIDARVSRGELNVLERELATQLIERAPGASQLDRIIADGKRMFAALGQRFEQLRVARSRRGEARRRRRGLGRRQGAPRRSLRRRSAQRYEHELGPITGGGYANAATRRWLRAYGERYGRLPDEARLTWPHPYVEDLIGSVAPPSPQLSLI